MVHALIVEDDTQSRKSLEKLVQKQGFSTSTVDSLAGAREDLAKGVPDLALIDLQLPDGDGMELLERLNEGDAEIVVITGDTSVDTAVEALHAGVADYLTKPIDGRSLERVLRAARRTLGLRRQVVALREELRSLGRFGLLVGSSPPMQGVYDLISKVAPSRTTVFLTGETGTGKDLIAQTIHRSSTRANAPYLPVNCAAIQPTLFESELFGHERGSFTGATGRHKGYFERGHGGTLFLDEITEMPLEMQVKLLRVLETGQVVRVGGSEPVDADVRVITATNRDPQEAVAEGKLRRDLFYRLMVFPIHIPPLRERGDDIELLASQFLEEHNAASEQKKSFTAQALDKLRSHTWPGNVRELRNVVERAYLLGREEITADAIHLEGEARGGPADGSELGVRVGMSIAEVERRLILATLERYEGDKPRAAKTLGISLKTLYNRLNRYASQEEEDVEPAAAGGKR